MEVSGDTIIFEGRFFGRAARYRLPAWEAWPGGRWALWPAPDGGAVRLVKGRDGRDALAYSIRYYTQVIHCGLIGAFAGLVMSAVNESWRVGLGVFVAFSLVSGGLGVFPLKLRFHDFLGKTIGEWKLSRCRKDEP